MSHSTVRILVALCFLWTTFLPASGEDSREQFFEARIRPLFAAHCFECHRDGAKGGLTIGSRDLLVRGGGSGAAIVPGDPDASLLIQAVSRTHKRLKMPPGKPLSARQVQDRRQWIKAGAVWLESPADFFRKNIRSFSAYEDAIWNW